jgi:hypothetical protein
MQNPLTNDVQYQAANYSTEFAPVDIVDLVPEIEKENKRQSDAFDKRIASQKANDQRRIDIASKPSALEELGKFSETLSKSLVDIQDKRNKAAMQRGLMKALSEGVSPEEQAQFDADEATLTEGKIEADKAAEEIQAQTGDVFIADKVRGLSGWEKYGYTKGLVQNGAANYSLYVATEAPNVSLQIGNRTVTFENAETPEEFAALRSYLSSKYVEQFQGINPALLNKYLFDRIRREDATAAINFAATVTKKREAELALGRSDALIGQLNSATPQAISNFILNHPKGVQMGRAEMVQIITAGIESGAVDPQQLLNALDETVTTSGGYTGPLSGLSATIYKPLQEAAQAAIRQDVQDRANDLKATQMTFTMDAKEALAEIVRSGRIPTDADIQALTDKWNKEFPGTPFPTDLSNVITVETAEIQGHEDRLDALIITRNGILLESDVANAPYAVREKYQEYVDKGKAINAMPQQTKTDIDRDIKANVKKNTLFLDGNKEINEVGEEIVRRARDDAHSLYAQYITDGYSGKDARDAALADVAKMIERGDYNKPREVGDSALSDRLQEARTDIAANPAVISTKIFLNQEERAATQKALEKGSRSELPRTLRLLAAQAGIDPWTFATEQMKAANITVTLPEQQPQSERDVDKLSPEIQSLLRRSPSASRTTRAALESNLEGDAKWFLDQVASKESASYGDYDAMNTGGSGMGPNNTARGSANSCDVTGCLSQMTLGEVMSLQSQGQIFAAGRYQFIPDTLRDTVKQLGLSMDTPFDAATQDALAIGRLTWRLSVQNSTIGLRNEWQGLWHVSDTKVNEMLDVGQDIVSVYRRPEYILPALRST